MPLTPDMRRSIDQIRDYLYGGGYPDPVTNAEQLSFLFSNSRRVTPPSNRLTLPVAFS